MNKPKIVCLCGSTKFKEEFIDTNFRFTMLGYIVLTVGFFSHKPDIHYTASEKEKEMLDELHKRKIDLADEIFVIDGIWEGRNYIGESTKSEIEYARSLNKPVIFWSTGDRIF